MNFLGKFAFFILVALYSFSIGSYTLGFILITLLVSLIDFRDYLLLRILASIQSSFLEATTITFCNPMHGKPVYLEAGATIYKLSATGNHDLHPLNDDGLEMKTHSDLHGTYTILDDKVVVKMKNKKGYFLHMGAEQMRQLARYFFEVHMDESKCVMNQSEDHYFKTEEVLFQLSTGMNLVSCPKLKSGYVLKIDAFLHKYLSSSYSLKYKCLGLLIKHNELFFSKLNPASLEKCLLNKMRFFDRPEGVKNSQWKWYTSDFCLIMSQHGYDYRSQGVWRPSKAFNELMELPQTEFELDDTEFTISCKDDRAEKELVKTLTEGAINKMDDITKHMPIVDPPKTIFDDRDPYNATYLRFENFVDEHNKEVKSWVEVCKLSKNAGKSVAEQKQIWKKNTEEAVNIFKHAHENLLKYKEAVLNPEQVKKNKPLTSKEGKRILWLREKGVNVERETVSVKHKSHDKFMKLGRELVKSQVAVNQFLLETKNQFEVLEKLSLDIAESLGEQQTFVYKTNAYELAKNIIEDREKTMNSPGRRKMKCKKKSSKSKSKTVKRIKILTGLKKYLSEDFNKAIVLAKMRCERLAFKENFRCKTVIEIEKYIKNKAGVDDLEKRFAGNKELLQRYKEASRFRYMKHYPIRRDDKGVELLFPIVDFF